MYFVVFSKSFVNPWDYPAYYAIAKVEGKKVVGFLAREGNLVKDKTLAMTNISVQDICHWVNKLFHERNRKVPLIMGTGVLVKKGKKNYKIKKQSFFPTADTDK